MIEAVQHFSEALAPRLFNTDRPVRYVTPEVAHYHLMRIASPYLGDNILDVIHLSPARLCRAIITLLTQAAAAGLSTSEALARLREDWENRYPHRPHLYGILAQITQQYRAFCLSQNIMDLPVAFEAFGQIILGLPNFGNYVADHFSLIVMDNLEDMGPVAHDFAFWVTETVPKSILIYDEGCGYQLDEGIDPVNGFSLSLVCTDRVQWKGDDDTRLSKLSLKLSAAIRETADWPPQLESADNPLEMNANSPLVLSAHSHFAGAITWCADQIKTLIDRGISPSEIILVSPDLSISMVADIEYCLSRAGIPSILPGSTPFVPDCVESILTMAQLGFPDTKAPSTYSIGLALARLIPEFDPVRASLLSRTMYRDGLFSSFDALVRGMQLRITPQLGRLFEQLRSWLDDNLLLVQESPLYLFAERFQGEVLAQPGFLLSSDSDADVVVSEMISILRDFAGGITPSQKEDWLGANKAIQAQMLSEGLPRLVHTAGEKPQMHGVFITSIREFLQSNHSVGYQFWLNTHDRRWWRESYTPLVSPHILRRSFTSDSWSDADELNLQRQTLIKHVTGLLQRCYSQVYVAYVDDQEAGFDRSGSLVTLIRNCDL
ncbi:MAG: hypothetical protein H6672_10175 [Anaerolineaceae bacterium]|nr:hypothetical protein [Anaerolineaceae bacterium]